MKPESANSLARAVAPLSSDEFLDRYWAKSFVHIPGWPGKFSDLLSWSRLNEILAYHQFPPENLHLLKNSEEVSAEKYVQIPSFPWRLNAAELTNFLADGGTLLLAHLDDLEPAVREVAADFERVFRTRVSVNLYAGWRTDNAFDLHWDDHHTLIFQLYGRKRWQVYNPTRLYPFRVDAEKAPRPTEPPIWEGVLEEGGLFHIPRGWWHAAYPLDEPCLHLTVAFLDPTGVELIHWLGEQLKATEIARKSIPYHEGCDELSAHLAAIWRALQDAWTPDLLDRYLESRQSEMPPRPILQLPFAATPNGLVLEKGSTIKLAPPCRLDLSGTPQNGVLSFRTFGRTWQCPEVVLPALHVLNDGQCHRVSELRALAPDESIAFEIQSFLFALVLNGVLTKVDVARGQTEAVTKQPR